MSALFFCMCYWMMCDSVPYRVTCHVFGVLVVTFSVTDVAAICFARSVSRTSPVEELPKLIQYV